MDEPSVRNMTTRASKRTEVRLPGPYVEPAPSESDTNTPNPDLITGDEDPTADSQDPKSPTSATPPARTPPERSSPPEDRPDPVDYEESEPDHDRERGEVPGPSSSPQLTEHQCVTHPGSPMTPKTAAAVARVDSQTRRESPRATAATVGPEQQIITNADIDEGVPPEQLQRDNRRHLRERTQQEESQAIRSKRERETSTPRTSEQLLAL
ncbi:unnamed protein product [Phytophthora fragariaefolia]|uniref:Unnamed protein product n=1 Tax=Phytophthora fragariaefolia TaxID=1490495 RepID=A0A9W6XE68_9STRA|nr:unnamed protein product [Phytophthora fragariaefolia]